MEVMQLTEALDIMNAEAERLAVELESSRKQAAEFSHKSSELRNDLTSVECMLGRNVREKGEALDKLETANKEIDRLRGLLCASCGGQGERCRVSQDGSYECEPCEDCKPKIYVRDGWQLVPIAPFMAMRHAFNRARSAEIDRFQLSGALTPLDMGFEAGYKAMLEAAPKLQDDQ